MRKTRKKYSSRNNRQTSVVKRRKSMKQHGGVWPWNMLFPKTSINPNKNLAKNLEYFDNNSVFLLSGHSSETGSSRYKLKGNEYFASPIECGKMTTGTIMPFFEFVESDPKIKIPNIEDETSLHPLSYNDFPFSVTWSINNNSLNNNVLNENLLKRKKWESDAFKLYFSQSSYKGTNTIPQLKFNFFSGKSILTSEKKIFHTYNGEPIKFTFNGKTDYIQPGDYLIFDISISGVLYPNQKIDRLINKIYELKEEYSNIIQNTFKLPNLGMYYLYVLIPAMDVFETETDYIHSDISYYKYLKEVLLHLTSLSYIGLDYWDFDNPEKRASELLFDAQMTIEDIFEFIRETKGDEPVFLINPLCRNIPSIVEVNYNSNYETNTRGLAPNSERRQRIEAKKLAASTPPPDSGGGAGYQLN